MITTKPIATQAIHPKRGIVKDDGPIEAIRSFQVTIQHHLILYALFTLQPTPDLNGICSNGI